MTVIRTGDEVVVFDPTPDALAYLKSLPLWGTKLGHARAWSQRKPGFWRCSLTAAAQLKALA